MKERVEATTVNGIITVSSIIFGFSTFQVRERREIRRVIFLLIFSLQVIVLSVVGFSYYASNIVLGYATVLTMTLATTSLYVNLFSSLLIWLLLSMQSEQQEDQQQNSEKKHLKGED
jgi:membrane-associated HD superfamily phosphohydrolase